MLDAADKVYFWPDDAGNLSPTGPQWSLPDKFIALYLSQALTSGKLSQIPHELPFHSFLLCSTSSRLFWPFPVLSLPFHFISVRVNPTCLNFFMHLVSWNLGWSLYFTGFMRWGDETGTAHKGSLVLDQKSADHSWWDWWKERKTALNWALGRSGDCEHWMVLNFWRLQKEGWMAWKHTFHFLGGRKFISV